MTDSEHDIQFPKVLCNCCKACLGTYDDPDEPGKVCGTCRHELEHTGIFLRAFHETHHEH